LVASIRIYDYMISVGIDIGSQFAKVVVLRDENIAATHLAYLGTDIIERIGFSSFMAAIEKADIPKGDVDCVTATGVGREYIAFADKKVSETLCNVRGVDSLNLGTDVLLDMGADKSMAVKYHNGNLIQVFRNDRCASGTGRFLDIVVKPLGIATEELGVLSLTSTKHLVMNSNCTVFAESEIISLIHQKERPEDIARAIFESMAEKVHSLLLKVGEVESLVIIGGLAKNTGLAEAIRVVTGFDLLIPQTPDPQMITALGAALIGCGKRKN
jgi:(R)-2-hydroxyacyl-CoA dehydratese activating ATPase